MQTIYQIPLQPTPQTFKATLVGVIYQLTLTYQNTNEGGWCLDIADSNGNPLVQGIPLVTGCNLLGQYEYLGIGGGLWVQTTNDPDAVPTFENLGVGSMLYFVTN